jgi:RimJ/RimL family protein N-acetyltransferase
MEENLFESERWTLRTLEPTDAAALQEIWNVPSMIGRRYTPEGVPDFAPMARGQVDASLETWSKEAKALNLAVVLRETGELVGVAIGNWHWDPHCPWVSVVIAPNHQRRGLGSEVLRTLLRLVFERLPSHTVHAGTSSWNVGGLAFARANGFSECGRMPRAGLRDGVYYEDVFFDLLRREWAELRGERDVA